MIENSVKQPDKDFEVFSFSIFHNGKWEMKHDYATELFRKRLLYFSLFPVIRRGVGSSM